MEFLMVFSVIIIFFIIISIPASIENQKNINTILKNEAQKQQLELMQQQQLQQMQQQQLQQMQQQQLQQMQQQQLQQMQQQPQNNLKS